MQTVLYAIGFVVIALIVARLIPVDSEPYHVEPGQPDKRRSEVRLIGLDAPRFDAPAETVLSELIKIVRADWNAGVVQGSAEEGMITVVARSPVFGFRDFITFKAVDEAVGSKLGVFARPRWNFYDWGANAKRLDRWLGELEQTLRR